MGDYRHPDYFKVHYTSTDTICELCNHQGPQEICSYDDTTSTCPMCNYSNDIKK